MAGGSSTAIVQALVKDVRWRGSFLIALGFVQVYFSPNKQKHILNMHTHICGDRDDDGSE